MWIHAQVIILYSILNKYKKQIQADFCKEVFVTENFWMLYSYCLGTRENNFLYISSNRFLTILPAWIPTSHIANVAELGKPAPHHSN